VEVQIGIISVNLSQLSAPMDAAEVGPKQLDHVFPNNCL